MSETDNTTQGQKPQISKLAVSSLVFSASGFTLTGVSLTVWQTMGAVALCLLLIAFSVICGVAALLMIAWSKKKLVGVKIAGLSIAASVALYFMIGPAIDIVKHRSWANRICHSNLCELGRAIHLYSEENNGKYPTADKWCDLLVEYADVNKGLFICESALQRGDTGPSHFAINPNCGPNSPPDTVLLFETKEGWNQFGWPELLSTKCHKGVGCYILFNDYSVNFEERSAELKWKEAGIREESKN